MSARRAFFFFLSKKKAEIFDAAPCAVAPQKVPRPSVRLSKKPGTRGQKNFMHTRQTSGSHAAARATAKIRRSLGKNPEGNCKGNPKGQKKSILNNVFFQLCIFPFLCLLSRHPIECVRVKRHDALGDRGTKTTGRVVPRRDHPGPNKKTKPRSCIQKKRDCRSIPDRLQVTIPP